MNKRNSRRQFIKQSSLTGLGAIALGSLSGCASHNLARENTGTPKIEGIDFEEVKKRYNNALFNRFIPGMDKWVIDHDLGGFMCAFNIDTRQQIASNKTTWFEGRGIWTYSFLYNNLDKDPKYLEVARKSKDFILRLRPADDKFYPASFTRDGKPVSTEEGNIYGNLFVAEGLAEYAKATGERHYFDLAREILFQAVARYDRPDFSYPYRAETRVPGPRILGHWMILLSLSTQMLKQGTDPEIEALADRCVNAIMNHHLNAGYKLLNEATAHDLSPLTDPVASQDSDIGHGCETLAFVMSYAVFRKDARLFHAAKDAFKRHVSVALDPVYGGYFHILNNVREHTWTLGKVRWLQEEILIGALIILEHTGDPWAIKCFTDADQYIEKKFVHPEYAFDVDSGDRKVETYPVTRAEHYHYPRMLMVTLLAIERITKRNGRTSGIFT